MRRSSRVTPADHGPEGFSYQVFSCFKGRNSKQGALSRRPQAVGHLPSPVPSSKTPPGPPLDLPVAHLLRPLLVHRPFSSLPFLNTFSSFTLAVLTLLSIPDRVVHPSTCPSTRPPTHAFIHSLNSHPGPGTGTNTEQFPREKDTAVPWVSSQL